MLLLMTERKRKFSGIVHLIGRRKIGRSGVDFLEANNERLGSRHRFGGNENRFGPD